MDDDTEYGEVTRIIVDAQRRFDGVVTAKFNHIGDVTRANLAKISIAKLSHQIDEPILLSWANDIKQLFIPDTEKMKGAFAFDIPKGGGWTPAISEKQGYVLTSDQLRDLHLRADKTSEYPTYELTTVPDTRWALIYAHLIRLGPTGLNVTAQDEAGQTVSSRDVSDKCVQDMENIIYPLLQP